MNHKQKYFYTSLGAVIMLVGILVGSIVSPPLIAQRMDMPGDLKCTSLTVVDRSGAPAIVLRADEALGTGITTLTKHTQHLSLIHISEPTRPY